MNKFEELYLKIINESWKYSQVQTKLTDKLLKENNFKHIFLDLNNILTETIKAAELTPVPDQVLLRIFQNLNNFNNNNVYSISYQQIIEIINQSEYQLQDIFIKNQRIDRILSKIIIKSDIRKKLQKFLKFKLDISEQHQTIKSMIKFWVFLF